MREERAAIKSEAQIGRQGWYSRLVSRGVEGGGETRGVAVALAEEEFCRLIQAVSAEVTASESTGVVVATPVVVVSLGVNERGRCLSSIC